MKTTIDKDGIMKIKAESKLEAYTLSKWCEENVKETVPPEKIKIETYCKNLLFIWEFEQA